MYVTKMYIHILFQKCVLAGWDPPQAIPIWLIDLVVSETALFVSVF